MIYIILGIIIFIWTINPFFKKILLRKLNKYEYLFYSSILIFLTALFGCLLLKNSIKNFKLDINSIKKLTKLELVYLVITSMGSVIASVLLLYLITKKDVSYIIPHIQALVIMLTAFIGCLLFNENINIYGSIGIILIVMGLILMNVKNK